MLSPREREVLEAIDRCGSVGANALEQFFAERMPADELGMMLEHLKTRRLVEFVTALRTYAVHLSRDGQRALAEAQRG